MTHRIWLTPGEPPAHTFIPATAGEARTLCGQYGATEVNAHLWDVAPKETPRCPDCVTLVLLQLEAQE